MLPDASAPGPAPAIQMPPSLPFGTMSITSVWCSVSALYAITHDVYGPASQYEAHVVKIVPPTSNSADRSLYCAGSNTTLPFELFAPDPG